LSPRKKSKASERVEAWHVTATSMSWKKSRSTQHHHHTSCAARSAIRISLLQERYVWLY